MRLTGLRVPILICMFMLIGFCLIKCSFPWTKRDWSRGLVPLTFNRFGMFEILVIIFSSIVMLLPIYPFQNKRKKFFLVMVKIIPHHLSFECLFFAL